MTLQIVGQHKGCIELNLNSSTVLNLKEAVSRASGLPIAGLKLLAGSLDSTSALPYSIPTSHLTAPALAAVPNMITWVEWAAGKLLKDDSAILAQCGIKQGQRIVVLRQDLSSKVDAEERLSRRTEEVAQAASLLSARAARDVDTTGTGNAWGGWRQDFGRGGPTSRRRDDRPRIELTNQDGETMAIPPEDSAALMEGIMLHKKGLACLRRLKRGRTQESQESARSEPKEVHSQSETSTAGSVGATTDPVQSSAGKTESSSHDLGKAGAERCKEHKTVVPGETRAQGNPQGKAWDAAQGPMPARAAPATEPGADGALGKGADEAKGRDDQRSPKSGGRAAASLSTEMSEERPTQQGGTRSLPSAQEKRLVQREALGLLLKAEEAFRRSDPAYLEQVDNYAYLCLDIVWLLFLMKDMRNLDLASRMLEAVEVGFKRAHGLGLQRLTALKGEFCAEKLLYVRLHLLQGVVAFLKGDSGTASALLIRASEEAKALRPDPVLATRLVHQWRSVKFEQLQRKVALRALRTGRNDLDAAWQYLEGLQHRKDLVSKEEQKRAGERRARRYGRTANERDFVDARLVQQLAAGGFTRGKVIGALRKHNNDVEAALAFLTSRQNAAKQAGVLDESVAVLESLGVPQDTARDVLSRTGSLCDALSELGISTPEGVDLGSSAQDGAGAQERKMESGEAPDGSMGRSSSDVGGSDDSEGGDGEGLEDEELAGPSAEEIRLYGELMEDREREGEEGHLDVTLEDEADAAKMYLHLCRGNIPLAFDLDRVRAGIAEAAAARGK